MSESNKNGGEVFGSGPGAALGALERSRCVAPKIGGLEAFTMDMEQMSGKRDCRYKKKSHSHRTELCADEGCIVCNDGTFIRAEQTPPVAGVHMDPAERLKVFWPNC